MPPQKAGVSSTKTVWLFSGSVKKLPSALAEELSSLEHRPGTPGLRAPSLARACARINHRMQKSVEQQINVSLSLPSFLSLSNQ